MSLVASLWFLIREKEKEMEGGREKGREGERETETETERERERERHTNNSPGHTTKTAGVTEFTIKTGGPQFLNSTPSSSSSPTSTASH